jgi:hypothetical protein
MLWVVINWREKFEPNFTTQFPLKLPITEWYSAPSYCKIFRAEEWGWET